jgi:hypothetical protein
VRDITFGGGQETTSSVLKVPRQCPLVLLVEAMYMIVITFYMTLEGLCYSAILCNIGRATLGAKLWCYHLEGCIWSMRWNLEFRYQLSICSRTEENHGKPWSSCPVEGPSRCELTSIQQSGIKYMNPNVSPYLCCCFIWKENLQFFRDLSFMCILWKNTKQLCITFAKRIHAYMHTYARKHNNRTSTFYIAWQVKL